MRERERAQREEEKQRQNWACRKERDTERHVKGRVKFDGLRSTVEGHRERIESKRADRHAEKREDRWDIQTVWKGACQGIGPDGYHSTLT